MNYLIKRILGMVSVSIVCLPVISAYAQDDTGVLEEIIVTAQKRQQSLQDVPISVSVLSGAKLEEANIELGYRADMRDYGVGIQILKDLKLNRVRLLTNNPKKADSFVLYGYELQLVSQEPLVAPSNPHNAKYLETKREKMGHLLESEELR